MKKVIKSNKPIYYLGITWLLYAAFFPLYKWYHYIVVASLSLIVFIFTKVKTPNEEIILAEPPAPKTEEQLALERMMIQGQNYISELESLDEQITDEKISSQILQIIDVSNKIFIHINEHPEKVKDIKMFMNYYLPTTINIIKSYRDLSVQSTAKSKDIIEALSKIENMLDKSLEGFSSLHSSLFTEKVLDVSADITVLEDLMEQHGLLDDQIKNQQKKEYTKSDEKEKYEQ